jgi:hypothetical protein
MGDQVDRWHAMYHEPATETEICPQHQSDALRRTHLASKLTQRDCPTVLFKLRMISALVGSIHYNETRFRFGAMRVQRECVVAV